MILDEFDFALNLLSIEHTHTCPNCDWYGRADETDNGDCPDCGAQVLAEEME